MEMGKLAAMLSAGVSLKSALAELEEIEIPREVRLGIELGAPLVPLLTSLDTQAQNQLRARGELAQALAVPQATRRLLIWLPFLTLGLTILIGIIRPETLLNPLVLACVLFGTLLLWVGNRISGRMLRNFSGEFDVKDLQEFQLSLSAGQNVSQIAKSFPSLLETTEVNRLISLSRKTGARLLNLVESQISLALNQQLSEKISEVRKLSVKLLIPLSLTTLPAFMLFVIPPTLVGLSK